MTNNILILSAGTRNKIVQYFKQNNLNGKIVCSDLSQYAPAIYDGDKWYKTPSFDDKSYIDHILKICEKENINAVLSLIDPELKILSENEPRFEKRNISLLQSSRDIIEKSFDKYDFYKMVISKGFKSQKSYIKLNEIEKAIEEDKLSFPLFVKPNSGSASININKVEDRDKLIKLFEVHDDLIVQEYIKGKEYGIDVFIDYISKKVVSIFIKEKIRMRAGETDKSIAVKNKYLINMIEEFVIEMGYLGQIDIDVFEQDGEYYISEVNPRFGGGYPHAYEAGCNFPKYIINNLNGNINNPVIGDYEKNTVMMKYNEVKFLKPEGVIIE